jgi:hypothetical protein
MDAINIYNARKKDSSLGGLGFWSIYLLFTLNGKIKAYNKVMAAQSGLTTEEMVQLGLI